MPNKALQSDSRAIDGALRAPLFDAAAAERKRYTHNPSSEYEMNDSEQHVGDSWVSASKDGPGPLIFHVRDAEDAIAALPSFAPPRTVILSETTFVLRWFRGEISLPPGGTAQAVPDDTCANWEWPGGSFLVVLIGAPPDHGLPHLDQLPAWPVGTWSVRVNRRAMALTLRAPRVDGAWHAEIDGYLDNECPFHAHVGGPAQTVRDDLIAGVLSLTMQRVEEPVRGV